jgi:hypothetical protein
MTVLVCIVTIWLMAKPSDERPNLRAGPGGTPSSRLFAVEHAATQDELAAAE